MTIKLTDSQRRKLRQMWWPKNDWRYNHCATLRLARQLEDKGLVHRMGTYTRYEWGRPVCTLQTMTLTQAGKALCEELWPEFKDCGAGI